jgi:hypothetical protein
MDYKKLTMLVIGGAVVLLGGYDVWVLTTSGLEASISYTIWTRAKEYPVSSFAMGFLMGHLFWQMKKS